MVGGVMEFLRIVIRWCVALCFAMGIVDQSI